MNTINDSRKLTLILGIVVALIALVFLFLSDSKDTNTVSTITDFAVMPSNYEAGQVMISRIADLIFY